MWLHYHLHLSVSTVKRSNLTHLFISRLRFPSEPSNVFILCCSNIFAPAISFGELNCEGLKCNEHLQDKMKWSSFPPNSFADCVSWLPVREGEIRCGRWSWIDNCLLTQLEIVSTACSRFWCDGIRFRRCHELSCNSLNTSPWSIENVYFYTCLGP